jgi:formylglycine-generating enzyme required for sulfatase activity
MSRSSKQAVPWLRSVCLALALPVAALCGCDAPSIPGKDASQALTTAGGIEMVALPGGWFEMGASDADEPDQQLHKVFVSPFAIDKYPVTQREYEKQRGANPSHWKGPQNPVEQIRWRDAAAYCNARSHAEGLQPAYDPKTWHCDFKADGYRLPTEAEYEYALRAGTNTAYFFGNSTADLPRYAWFKANSTRGSHPVGEKPANPWGLCDMVGNVYEWCNDYYQEDYYKESPDHDPRGPARGQDRVVRGGCWNSKPDDLRSAYRNYETPAYTDICFAKDIHGQVGFRCVRRQAGK